MALGLSDGLWQYKVLKRRSTSQEWWDVPSGWVKFGKERSEKVQRAMDSGVVGSWIMLQMMPNVSYKFWVDEIAEGGRGLVLSRDPRKGFTVYLYCRPIKPVLADLVMMDGDQDGMLLYTFTKAFTGDWLLTSFGMM